MTQEEVDLIYKHCRVEGCNKKSARHRICAMHQSRWNRNKSYELITPRISFLSIIVITQGK